VPVGAGTPATMLAKTKKTATMLRFSNIATSAAVKESDHQFWA